MPPSPCMHVVTLTSWSYLPNSHTGCISYGVLLWWVKKIVHRKYSKGSADTLYWKRRLTLHFRNETLRKWMTLISVRRDGRYHGRIFWPAVVRISLWWVNKEFHRQYCRDSAVTIYRKIRDISHLVNKTLNKGNICETNKKQKILP